MNQGECANAVVVWLKSGQREVYDSSYYKWEVCDGILTFTDEDSKKIIIYALSNVHKVEIENY